MYVTHEHVASAARTLRGRRGLDHGRHTLSGDGPRKKIAGGVPCHRRVGRSGGPCAKGMIRMREMHDAAVYADVLQRSVSSCAKQASFCGFRLLKQRAAN